MAEQNCFQFGRGNLKPFVLDEFLQPVDHVQMAICVDVADVTGVQPPIGIYRCLGRLRVVEVALHHLRPAHADLPVLIDPEIHPAHRIDDPCLRIRRGDSDRSWLEPAGWREMRNRRQLGHPVALDHLTPQPPAAFSGQISLQRRCPGENLFQRAEVELAH